jgi:hypothetical protein
VGEKSSDKFCLEFDFHVILEIFYMPQICDMGQKALLPPEDFFALKSPTASAGFEPTKLGTKGQHATSRPPKPAAKLCSRENVKKVMNNLACKVYTST